MIQCPKCKCKFDPTPQKAAKENKLRQEALDVLAYLNKMAGTTIGTRKPDSHLKFIVARLKEGYGKTALMDIIDMKVEQWGRDQKMAGYLKPSTLFNALRCDEYTNELWIKDKLAKDTIKPSEGINTGHLA